MRIVRIFAVLAFVFLLAGCAGMSPTEQNVLGGGVLGAGLGAGISAATGGNPAAGAAIGGAAGLIGGAIKDSWDRQRERDYYYRDRGYYAPY